MNEMDVQIASKGLLFKGNPVLIQLLGLSPVLAISSTAAYGMALGIITFLVCVLSCLTASLLRMTIPHNWRLVWFMLILASYTTIFETLCQLFFYPLYLRLGIYLPLVCCNVAILVRMEVVSAKSDWLSATLDATRAGLGFVTVLLAFAACRELLSSGSLLHNWQLLLPTINSQGDSAATLGGTPLFQFANTQAGALILLGLLVALLNWVLSLGSNSEGQQQEDTALVKRARVTGRLSKE
jgi:H+/Na+-translocating ferredoxin:NAD+ oxidoreductase subunit E